MMKLIITPGNADNFVNSVLFNHLHIMGIKQVDKSIHLEILGDIGSDELTYLSFLVKGNIIDSFEVRRGFE
jgi:hypothetical protein